MTRQDTRHIRRSNRQPRSRRNRAYRNISLRNREYHNRRLHLKLRMRRETRPRQSILTMIIAIARRSNADRHHRSARRSHPNRRRMRSLIILNHNARSQTSHTPSSSRRRSSSRNHHAHRHARRRHRRIVHQLQSASYLHPLLQSRRTSRIARRRNGSTRIRRQTYSTSRFLLMRLTKANNPTRTIMPVSPSRPSRRRNRNSMQRRVPRRGIHHARLRV